METSGQKDDDLKSCHEPRVQIDISVSTPKLSKKYRITPFPSPQNSVCGTPISQQQCQSSNPFQNVDLVFPTLHPSNPFADMTSIAESYESGGEADLQELLDDDDAADKFENLQYPTIEQLDNQLTYVLQSQRGLYDEVLPWHNYQNDGYVSAVSHFSEVEETQDSDDSLFQRAKYSERTVCVSETELESDSGSDVAPDPNKNAIYSAKNENFSNYLLYTQEARKDRELCRELALEQCKLELEYLHPEMKDIDSLLKDVSLLTDLKFYSRLSPPLLPPNFDEDEQARADFVERLYCYYYQSFELTRYYPFKGTTLDKGDELSCEDEKEESGEDGDDSSMVTASY